MSIDGKIAFVTGANQGIGLAIANNLASRGAIVIGTGIVQEAADMITTHFAEQNYKGEGVLLDVTRTQDINDVLSTIRDKYGDPAILINNAGITKDNLMMRMKDEEWDAVINTNLSALYHVTQACLKGMIKARWGRIINLSSVVGVTGNAGQVNYSASKGGVLGLTRSLAQEIGSRGITVNAIAPGFIDTPMTRSLSDDQRNALLSKIPLKRLGQAEDIAKAALFLASDDAAYITGATLHVNGGMYMG